MRGVDLPLPHAPFVGRAGEIDALHGVFGSIEARGPCVVLLEGVAGAGKSRLLEEGLASADLLSITLNCSPRPITPLSDIVPLLRWSATPAEVIAAISTSIVTGAVSLSPAGLADAEQGGALLAAAESVAAMLSAGPLVFVVEDLHWAGDALLRWLDLVAGRVLDGPPPAPVAVVITSRPLPPAHAGRPLLDRLSRRPRWHPMVLGPLASDEEDRLVRSCAPGSSVPFVDLVRRTAKGNPLRLRTSVEVLRRRGVGVDLDAIDPRAGGNLQLDPAFDDPVTMWLSDLDDDLRRGLGKLSVLGQEFGLTLAAAALDCSRAAATDFLDQCTEVQVLRTDGSAYWFDHPLFGEVLHDTAPMRDRRAAHLRCAEALEAADADGANALAIGTHLLQADELAPVDRRRRALVSAGRACLAMTAWAEAIRFFEAALQCRPAGSDDGADYEVELLAGHSHYFNHDEHSARAHFERAIPAARATGDEESWASGAIGLARLTNIMHARSYQEASDTSAVEELADLARSPRLRALALQMMAEARIGAGDAEVGLEMARQAVTLLGPDADLRDLAPCQFAVAYGELTRLHLASAVGHGLRALKTAQRGLDWYFELVTASRTAIAAFGAGDLRLATALADDSVKKGGECREASCHAIGHVVHGALAVVRGDRRGATSHAAAAASHGRRSGHAAVAYHAVPLQLYLAVESGQAEEASSVLASAWGELPPSATAPFLEMLDRRLRLSITATVGVRPPRLRQTWLGAGIFVAQCVAALDRDDRAWLHAALPMLQQLTDRGLQFTISYPAAVDRVQADALARCGQMEEAVAAYTRAADICRRQEAYAELALALLGRAATEAAMEGPSVDHVRQLAAEAAALAHRLDLPAVQRSAARLAADLDHPDNVTRRQGRWRVILITDIVGSTRVSHDLGDRAYYQLVQQHHEIVRRCLGAHRGHEFSETGDGLLAWFASTVDAVSCSIAIQRGSPSAGPARPTSSSASSSPVASRSSATGVPSGSCSTEPPGCSARPTAVRSSWTRQQPPKRDFTSRSAPSSRSTCETSAGTRPVSWSSDCNRTPVSTAGDHRSGLPAAVSAAWM